MSAIFVKYPHKPGKEERTETNSKCGHYTAVKSLFKRIEVGSHLQIILQYYSDP